MLESINTNISDIVATHCCICSRKLKDAESVNTGIGPICSKKYYALQHEVSQSMALKAIGQVFNSEDLPKEIKAWFLSKMENNNYREAANILLKYASSITQEDPHAVFEIAGILRTLGFVTLADKLQKDRTKIHVVFGEQIEVLAKFQSPLLSQLGEKIQEKRKDVGWKIDTKHQQLVLDIVSYHSTLEHTHIMLWDEETYQGVMVPQESKSLTSLREAVAKATNTSNILVTPVKIFDLEKRGRDGITSPYNAKFVEGMRKIRNKRWNPRNKQWEFDHKHIGKVWGLVKECYNVVPSFNDCEYKTEMYEGRFG